MDYLIKIGDFPLAFSIEYFDTKLSDVFIMEEDGTDNSGNTILIRKNGESAAVRGGTFEMASEFKDFSFKAGYTLQSSKFNQMVQWSAGDEEAGIDAQYSDEILRTPSQYGYFTLNYSPLANLFINLSGVYTGSMNIPHYAGGIDPSGNEIQRDVLKLSGAFFELNSKISYQILNVPKIEIGLGMQNMLNQFQNDFDRGINRDAGYIYGPSRPRTTYFEISTQL